MAVGEWDNRNVLPWGSKLRTHLTPYVMFVCCDGSEARTAHSTCLPTQAREVIYNSGHRGWTQQDYLFKINKGYVGSGVYAYIPGTRQ